MWLNRRHLMAMAGGAAVLPTAASPSGWHMPDEGDPHRATWMAFGPRAKVWGERLLPHVRRNLGQVARSIAAFEPVHMLVREAEFELARRLCGPDVRLLVQGIDDLWMRDTGPVFVRDSKGQWAGIDFNFNGWGGKQEHAQDAEVAAFVLEECGFPRIESELVLEGGGIEVDGDGTALITESCVLNPNRNPGVSKAQCERELGHLLGLQKIIWLPGIVGKDITDGHTDFYARFTEPGVVVAALDTDPQSYDHEVTQQHLRILRQARDAKGRPLKVHVMPAPRSVRPALANDEFAAGYINFYVCNGAVIAPQFGDRTADANSRALLRELFPKREIVQLDIDGIAAGGGGIHCTTQQQPR